MKTSHLDNMIKGWFIGSFEPTLINTDQVEVAVKKYKKGEYEDRHYHKIATEITVVVSGRILMNGVEYGAGDIVVIEPCESTDFEALEDTVNTVVKFPGATQDKYLGEYNND
ncbi:hypothetical protein [Marinomonas sp. FW-1]|uniref:hypothetical protein n=1 Tax=Marinomonas sp. FW-1 TaxID=2071621 RepID=UPI0010C0D66C|nr:hypothetical protein [Marinomonas sp. FW-1]